MIGKPAAQHRTVRSGLIVLGTVVSLTLSVLAGVLAVGAIGVVSAAPASAAPAANGLACDQNTIYGIDASGNMDSINVSTGATSLVKSDSPAFNAIGLTSNGVASYQFGAGTTNSPGTTNVITKYNPATDQVTQFGPGIDASAPNVIIRGAVNPKTGIYYYGGSGRPLTSVRSTPTPIRRSAPSAPSAG